MIFTNVPPLLEAEKHLPIAKYYSLPVYGR